MIAKMRKRRRTMLKEIKDLTDTELTVKKAETMEMLLGSFERLETERAINRYQAKVLHEISKELKKRELNLALYYRRTHENE
jgi:hypothetical protein